MLASRIMESSRPAANGHEANSSTGPAPGRLAVAVSACHSWLLIGKCLVIVVKLSKLFLCLTSCFPYTFRIHLHVSE